VEELEEDNMNIRRIRKPNKRKSSDKFKRALIGNEKKSLSTIRKKINENGGIKKKKLISNVKRYGRNSAKKYNKQNFYLKQMKRTEKMVSIKNTCPPGYSFNYYQINYTSGKNFKINPNCYPIV
jgi:hypothetical protein